MYGSLLRPGNITVIVARSGVGKTQFCIDFVTKTSEKYEVPILHFDNGAVGILQNSWTSGRRVFRVEMHAPNICAEAEHEGKGYLYADGDYHGAEYDTREIAGSDQNFIYGGFQAKNRNFIDCIKSGDQPESNLISVPEKNGYTSGLSSRVLETQDRGSSGVRQIHNQSRGNRMPDRLQPNAFSDIRVHRQRYQKLEFQEI